MTLRPRAIPLLAVLSTAWPLAVLAAPVAPDTAADTTQKLQQLQALVERMQVRIDELETGQKRLDGASARPPSGQWGMTPEQARELSRVVVKAAGTEDALEAQGFRGLKISGYLDPTYIATRNLNRRGFQFLDSSANGEYAIDNGSFGTAQIDFMKETDSGAKWHLTLMPNRGASGLTIDGQSIVQEASLSMPLGDKQTRLIAGQIPDWSGHEYAQAPQNKLVSHNLLFDFTIPTVYTGLGLELVRDEWTIKTLLANVNSSKRAPGEHAPALAWRVDHYNGEFSGFGAAGLHGKLANWRALLDEAGNPLTGEPYATRDTVAHLIEVDGWYTRGDWTVTGQLSYGQQSQAAITADPTTGELRTARWWGLSATAAYKLTPQWELVVRGDHLNNQAHGGGLLGWTFADDRNGIGPDPLGDPERGANRQSLSLGTRYQFDANLAFKAEYRLDQASLPVFLDVTTGRYRSTNAMLGAAMVMSF